MLQMQMRKDEQNTNEGNSRSWTGRHRSGDYETRGGRDSKCLGFTPAHTLAVPQTAAMSGQPAPTKRALRSNSTAKTVVNLGLNPEPKPARVTKARKGKTAAEAADTIAVQEGKKSRKNIVGKPAPPPSNPSPDDEDEENLLPNVNSRGHTPYDEGHGLFRSPTLQLGHSSASPAHSFQYSRLSTPVDLNKLKPHDDDDNDNNNDTESNFSDSEKERRAGAGRDAQEPDDDDPTCPPPWEIKPGPLSAAGVNKALAARQAYHNILWEVAREDRKKVSAVLKAIGETTKLGRKTNPWNAFQMQERSRNPQPKGKDDAKDPGAQAACVVDLMSWYSEATTVMLDDQKANDWGHAMLTKGGGQFFSGVYARFKDAIKRELSDILYILVGEQCPEDRDMAVVSFRQQAPS
ncbi:hypothetical protein B0H17DRAFT_1124961 [Mycena rosella]|uniref:Uncharacterized protein n=1 Tax=Mycena rosella TaxID=1033263 RepID=A0AAD7GYS9_MYCRO|nr:hypothetical protein B0H17DRAFT_1124961 [Mycena rosella]